MDRPARLPLPGIAALVLAFGSLAFAISDPPTSEQANSTLEKWLTKRGFVAVPIILNKAGWLDVKVEVEGVPMLLMLDTGANNINLDRGSAQRAKLTVKEAEGKTAALGGAVATGMTKIAKLTVGEMTSPADSYVIDFSSTNTMRKNFGEPSCDGVLGGSFLTYWSAIVDYAHLKLYLLDPETKALNPSRLLRGAGYAQIPLEYSKSGTLEASVAANGKPLLLFLDTGARDYLSLDRASAKRAELLVKENESKNAELGGTVVTGSTKIDRLDLGPLHFPIEVHVNDFTHTNESRKILGAPPCDGTLNGGLFRKHSAIIDYVHKKLYLLDLEN